MQYLVQEETFVRQVLNAKDKLLKNQKVTLFKFLDQRKQDIIKSLMAHNLDNVLFYGGFENCEYNRCIISPFEINNDSLKVSVFKIVYNKRYLTVSHKNILGNLMSLGIKRESIGDIVIDNDAAYFACCNEIETFILEEFKVFNKMPITLKKITNIKISNQVEYDVKDIIVSSLRLDVVLSKVFGLSRNESKDIILEKRVKVNHVQTSNISLSLNQGDLLSVQKKGRVKFLEISSVTSKDKNKIKIGYLK